MQKTTDLIIIHVLPNFSSKIRYIKINEFCNLHVNKQNILYCAI